MHIPADIREIVDDDNTALGVDLGGLGFVESDACPLVAEDVTERFDDRTVLDGTGGARGEERGKEEEVAGGYDDDVVVIGVELLEERNASPAGTCELCQILLIARRAGGDAHHVRSGDDSVSPTVIPDIPKITSVFFDGSGSTCSIGFRVS